jgi:hypothetical protein
MPKKKKKTAKKKAAIKAKKPATKKIATKKSAAKKPEPKKPAKLKKPAAAKKPVKKAARRSSPRSSGDLNEARPMAKGPGAGSAGQSGDLEGLSDVESADSESVEELVEEGQDFEAELVNAVENAPDPDQGELTTEVPEDDLDPESGSFSNRNRL